MVIKVDRPKDLQSIFSRAKDDAGKYRVSWVGDTEQGYCYGLGFEGRYVVDADCISVHVLKKPLFVSKAKIEKAVRRYLFECD